MSLQQWQDNGWLRRHEPTRGEIEDLLAVVDRDLEDSAAEGLSPDWRLNIAYNAALQAATAALVASGYRVRRGESHHYRAIQSLRHTIGADPDLVAQLDAFRKKRNQMSYERAGVVSEQEAEEMVALARDIRNRVRGWLEEEHGELW